MSFNFGNTIYSFYIRHRSNPSDQAQVTSHLNAPATNWCVSFFGVFPTNCLLRPVFVLSLLHYSELLLPLGQHLELTFDKQRYPAPHTTACNAVFSFPQKCFPGRIVTQARFWFYRIIILYSSNQFFIVMNSIAIPELTEIANELRAAHPTLTPYESLQIAASLLQTENLYEVFIELALEIQYLKEMIDDKLEITNARLSDISDS